MNYSLSLALPNFNQNYFSTLYSMSSKILDKRTYIKIKSFRLKFIFDLKHLLSAQSEFKRLPFGSCNSSETPNY